MTPPSSPQLFYTEALSEGGWHLFFFLIVMLLLFAIDPIRYAKIIFTPFYWHPVFMRTVLYFESRRRLRRKCVNWKLSSWRGIWTSAMFRGIVKEDLNRHIFYSESPSRLIHHFNTRRQFMGNTWTRCGISMEFLNVTRLFPNDKKIRGVIFKVTSHLSYRGGRFSSVILQFITIQSKRSHLSYREIKR